MRLQYLNPIHWLSSPIIFFIKKKPRRGVNLGLFSEIALLGVFTIINIDVITQVSNVYLVIGIVAQSLLLIVILGSDLHWHKFVRDQFTHFPLSDQLYFMKLRKLSITYSSVVLLANFLVPILTAFAFASESPYLSKGLPYFVAIIAFGFLRIPIRDNEELDSVFKALEDLPNVSEPYQRFSIEYLMDAINNRSRKRLPHIRMDLGRIFTHIYCTSFLGSEKQIIAKRDFLKQLREKMKGSVEEILRYLIQESQKIESELPSHNLITTSFKWEGRITFRERVYKHGGTIILIVSIVVPLALPYLIVIFSIYIVPYLTTAIPKP